VRAPTHATLLAHSAALLSRLWLPRPLTWGKVRRTEAGGEGAPSALQVACPVRDALHLEQWQVVRATRVDLGVPVVPRPAAAQPGSGAKELPAVATRTGAVMAVGLQVGLGPTRS
jgi:hypothetical protein